MTTLNDKITFAPWTVYFMDADDNVVATACAFTEEGVEHIDAFYRQAMMYCAKTRAINVLTRKEIGFGHFDFQRIIRRNEIARKVMENKPVRGLVH